MFLLTFFLLETLGQQCQTDQIYYNQKCYNSSCINNYRQRLGVLVNENQSSILTLPIKSSYNTTINGLNLYVTFQDDIKDHLFQRDNPLSCLTYRLNFYSIQFNRIISDLTAQYPIFSALQNPYETTYQFYIPAIDYQTSLIPAYCVDLGWCYIGYIGFDIYIESTSQASFQIRLLHILNSTTNNQAPLNVGQLIMNQNATCNDSTGQNCTQKIQTTLRFCNDWTCQYQSDFINPVLNQNIYLIQKITNDPFKNWTLSDTLIQFQGQGLQNPVLRINESDYNNSVKGQIIIKIKIRFVYSNITILVSSVLNQNPTSHSRLLIASDQYDAVRSSVASAQLQCILENEGDQVCPNCERQRKINGFSECFAQIINIMIIQLFL
ncbi:hypothetical protein pb186bvf_018157 [Paramecium bursaria]